MQSLVFYIGNGILKCALVDLSSGSQPKLLLVETSDVETGEGESDKVQLEISLNRSLDSLCQKAKKLFLDPEIKNKSIDKIICIVTSPWYLSETKTLRTVKPEPFLIKEDTISKFVEEAENDMQRSYHEEMEPSERKIIHVSLNGYVTNDPVHQRASTLEVSLVQSFVEKKLMADVKNTIERYFDAPDFGFHTLSLASFIALRDVISEKDNFILLDITSLITEVSLIKQNILYETISLPIGARKLLEMIGKKLKISLPVAMSIMSRYQGGQTEAKMAEKVKAVLDEFKKSWNEYLTDAFSHLSGGVSLPSSCYILSQLPLENIFSGFVTDEEYGQFSFSEGKFKVELISGTLFLSAVDFNKHPMDPSLAIAAIFTKKIIDDKMKRVS